MKQQKKNKLDKVKVAGFILLVACIVVCALLGTKLSKLDSDYTNLKNDNHKKQDNIESYSKDADELSSEKASLEANVSELESASKDADAANKDLVNQINTLQGNTEPEETTMSESQYSSLYPDMYVSEDDKPANDKKIVYLTFDDGPSDLTPQYLDILKENGINATFFVTYQPDHEDLYKKEVEDGNRVQVHTASHDYTKIYQSVEAYMEDFEKMYSYIVEVTGQKPDCFRFPGGSTNSYGASTTKAIAREMSRRGFTFFDWNVSVGDGNANATRQSIIEKIKTESEGRNTIVMLAHDSASKGETLAALPEIIKYYKDNGYEFGIVDGTVDPSVAQYIEY